MDTTMLEVSVDGVEEIASPFEISGLRILRFGESGTGLVISYGAQAIRIVTSKSPLVPLEDGRYSTFAIEFDSDGRAFPHGSHRFTGHYSDFEELIQNSVFLYRKMLLTQLFDSFGVQIRRMFSADSVKLDLERFEVDDFDKAAHLGCRLDVSSVSFKEDLRVVLGYDFTHDFFISRVGLGDRKWMGDSDVLSEAVMEPALEVSRIIYNRF